MKINKNLKKYLENNKIPRAQKAINRKIIYRISNKNKIIILTKIQTLKINFIKPVNRIKAIMIIMNLVKSF